jgi:hypothetical protein
MVRLGIRALFVLAILACCAVGPAGAGTKQVYVHLFTVPTDLPGGGGITRVLPDFEVWLAESFGGYTRLGAGDGAWKNEQGQIEAQGNTVYLVSADRDASADIAARLTRDFGERAPYMLVFPAGRFVK